MNDRLHDRNEHELILCRYGNGNNNDRYTECLASSNLDDDPLGEPEVTVSLNEGSALPPLRPIQEPEEDIFDYEIDISSQDDNVESEEQVVPSSQLGGSYKYPEDLSISNDEIDEGIFEDEYLLSYNPTVMDNNNRHDPQPP